MEWLKRIGEFFEEGSVSNIPIEEVYGQLLKYHQELLQVFAPQSTMLPPRLIMFQPMPSVQDIQAMPDKLTAAEAEELVPFIRNYEMMGEAFNVPKYDAEFINRGYLKSREILDQTLAEKLDIELFIFPKIGFP